MTEAFFISHCEEDCGLGVFEYECPCCGVDIQDFDVWWEKDNVYAGKLVSFKCERCLEDLVVSWNDKEFEFQVNKK